MPKFVYVTKYRQTAGILEVEPKSISAHGDPWILVVKSGWTPAQIRVLEVIARDGSAVAGRSAYRGRVENLSAQAMLALERAGIVTISIGPDGGMMARAAPVTGST